MAPRFPPPPAYDPEVAAAIYEQTNILSQLKIETSHPEFTLQSLARGLSLKQQHDLSHIVKPLSTSFKLPCKQDLGGFWKRAERAIRGLGKNICVDDFT
jgi:hypothetical protein